MSGQPELLLLKNEARKKSYSSDSFYYIFDRRRISMSFNVNLLKTLGILVPALVGATALGYSIDSKILSVVIYLAIPLTIVQFGISVWATLFKWDEQLAYSMEAAQAHSTIHDKFVEIAQSPESYEKLKRDYDMLSVEFRERCLQNSKYNIKEWEKRRGMRYSLLEADKECSLCLKAPESMLPDNCWRCGRYSLRYKTLPV